VLEAKFGVPRDRTGQAAELILDNGKHSHLLVERDGRMVVALSVDQQRAGRVDAVTWEPEATSDRVSVETPDWSRVCFYITPIGEEGTEVRRHSDMLLTHLVVPAAEEHGLVVVRADRIAKSGLITQQVFEYLVRARVCVADLSFGNPNAFYELGVRHVCKLPAVQIIRKGEKIPFDVSQGRTINIGTTDVYTVMDKIASGRRELSEHLRSSLEEKGASSDNPVHFYLPGLKVSIP
jgi:hypothetical protein